jgi:hypothetical protein
MWNGENGKRMQWAGQLNKPLRLKNARWRRDQRGSIEGLPLYLLVSALVVAVALSALLSLMGGLQGQTLGSVEPDKDAITVSSARQAITFNVTVKDTTGRAIEGATVEVSGLGVAFAKKTDAAGKAKVTVTVDLATQTYGELDVLASFHGPIGETSRGTSVLVARA